MLNLKPFHSLTSSWMWSWALCLQTLEVFLLQPRAGCLLEAGVGEGPSSQRAGDLLVLTDSAMSSPVEDLCCFSACWSVLP